MIKLNGVVIEHNHFPDGTLLSKFPNDAVKVDNCITWNYESDSELFLLYCLKRKIDDMKKVFYIKTVVLDMPYVPHARQDRVKRAEDIFTLKYFSEIINSLNFDVVYTLDNHSPVSEALINNITINKAEENICSIISHLENQVFVDGEPVVNVDNVVVFYPDTGAYKKYSDFICRPACYGIKNRNWQDGKILGLNVITNGIDLKGKTILMVDDIISYGGSMYYSAKKLKELGCGEIYIYASHVENSILEGELIKSGLFEKIYTTNSIFTKEHEKIEVLK